MAFQPWRKLSGRSLRIVLNAFTAVALIFEGYNQGVQGNISAAPGFIDMAKIGANGKVTNSTKQGGLISAYYFGAIFGCFLGGWLADRFGRKKAVWLGSCFCLLGAALQAASQNANWFLCARVIAGVGIGFVNTIVPPWISELARAHDRGANFALVFVANYLGIIIAYWLDYGVKNTGREFMWRFPLAFMTVPSLIIILTTFFLPDSPRWLIANGHRTAAITILAQVRGDLPLHHPALAAELAELEAVVESSKHARNRLWNIACGRYSGRLHLGRRAWMGFAMQQMMLWSGIMAITTYSGSLFEQAGFSTAKASWMAGFCNSLGGVGGTAAAALVIDRLGRIKSCIVGYTIQGLALFLTAAFLKTSQDSTDTAQATRLGVAAASMLFVFLWFYSMFLIVPAWLYPTEIWPQEVRSQGYAFTILGWAVGCGVTTLVIPIMLARVGWATFLVFGSLNIVAIPITYLIYPETNGRSLEEINLLFTSPSLLVSENEEAYRRLVADAAGVVAVAERRLLDRVDAEEREELEARAAAAEEEAEEGKDERRVEEGVWGEDDGGLFS